MDGVIEVNPGKEYVVKVRMSDIKFYAPTLPNPNQNITTPDGKTYAAKNYQPLNLIPLPDLIRMSGKKNGINCSFFQYSYPWWVGPYKDNRNYDPFYKPNDIESTLYITNSNTLHVSINKLTTIPADVKYIVCGYPVAVENGVKRTKLKSKKRPVARRSMIGSLNDGSFFIYIFDYPIKFQEATDNAYKYLGNIQNAFFIDGGTSTSLIINHKIVVKTGYKGFPNAIVW